MSMIKEFREFAVKGNVVDMAVGIVIGGGFGKIVSSFVSDVIMPPVGVIAGGVDFTDLKVTLQNAVGSAPAVTLNYGKFVQSIIDFTIVAFAMFMLIKFMNALRRKSEAPSAPPAPSRQEVLLEEIRDALKKR